MTDNAIYQASFACTLFRITPSLRYIFFDIIRNNQNKIILVAFFESDASEIEKELMEDIASDIAGIIDEVFSFEVKIETTKIPFEKMDKSKYLLYARFEGIGFE